MKSFLKQVFASFFGSCFPVGVLLVLLALPVVVSIVGVAGLLTDTLQKSAERAVPAMPKRAVLVIDLSRGFSDTPTLAAANRPQLFSSQKGAYGLLDTLFALKTAETDESICGVLLLGGNAGAATGYSAAAELIVPLQNLSACGKPVFAYLPSPTLGDYLLATAGDKVWLHPFAELPLQGLSSSGLYFKQALENIGVGVQITRVGTHKSAVEPLIADAMSPEDRAQRERLLKNLSNVLYFYIADNRTRSAREPNDFKPLEAYLEKFLSAQNSLGLVPAKTAVENGFADAALYEDEMLEELKKLAGTDEETHSFPQVSLDDYLKIRGIAEEPPLEFGGQIFGGNALLAAEASASTETAPGAADDAAESIAVVYAEGDIVDGAGTVEEVGGQTYSRILRDLRNDDSVKAVVLRINSPGGSVFASEQIRREAELLAQKKPLVVSMGSVAASGGYWISTPAKKVFALPTTATGSIGVFGILFNFENMGKKLGVHSDAVSAAPFAEIETVRRPKTPAELAIFQQSVDRIYAEFLRLVANARGLTIEQVDAVAQGQVWCGQDAQNYKLVDDLGGLMDAIAYAKQEAGLPEDAPIVSVPGNVNRYQSLFDALDDSSAPVASAGTPFGSATQNPALKFLAENFQRISARLRAFNDPNGLYARIPFDVPASEK